MTKQDLEQVLRKANEEYVLASRAAKGKPDEEYQALMIEAWAKSQRMIQAAREALTCTSQ